VILLDTDHFSALKYRANSRRDALLQRMEQSTDSDFALTPITLEEQTRGWLAKIHAAKSTPAQVPWYALLTGLFQYAAAWRIVAFDAAAAGTFERLRRDRIRIGSMDLKIASIALTHHTLLLSSNLRDFRQIPGLRVEDWLA
jgi:tRNA(fMet)-specific endonuclease VapC